MTDEFSRLRAIGIWATLQTLPGGFRVTLQKGMRTCWGAGATAEQALEAALKEWNNGKV